MNNTFTGKNLKLTIYGKSHEPKMGFYLEGFPKVFIDFDLILKDIKKRQPSTIETTSRQERDIPYYIKGFNNGYTTGDTIEVEFLNENYKHADYDIFYDHPRPGHVDFVLRKKYQDPSQLLGGGMFSGRMTLPLMVAGSLCKQALPYRFRSKIVQVGTCTNLDELDTYLTTIIKAGDSVGGIVEVLVEDVPIGIGGPLFKRLTAKIAQLVLSIPGSKGIEFGAGFNSPNLLGSEFNDLIVNEEGKTRTNHAGGFSGGMTNGNDLIIKVSFRPPSSISKPQMTYSFKTNQIEELTITGRHDISYIQRVLVVVENMVALALLDEIL